MGIDGKLKDPSGRPVNNNDYYRYDNEDDNTDTLNIRRQLQEEKRKREESDKRIKELEKKQKESKPVTGKEESMESNEDGTVARSSTPVFSLVESFF
jgi:hypothetical protein